MSFSAPRYEWGDVARVRVVTSTNTASAELRVGSYTHPLHRERIGLFRGAYHVPLMPPIFRPRYTFVFEVVVRNAAGVAARRGVTVPVD